MDDAASAITERIVTAVAAETGRDVTELPPLYDAVDPEQVAAACHVFETGETTFRYAGRDITVSADRSVDVAATGMGGRRQPQRASDD